MIRVFVGYDPAEERAYNVCVRSMRKNTYAPIDIRPLRQEALRWAGLYRRAPYPGTRIDTVDDKPFSTEFSFTRFLVPAVMLYEGWALFCDCDFLWLDSVLKLWDMRDNSKAVMVVKHQYAPTEAVKMNNAAQQVYPRKNWSSLILWNCGHKANRQLTPDMISNAPGAWLHAFEWLPNELIGSLSEQWNWLEGHSSTALQPSAVHMTRGGPWFQDPPPVGMNLKSWMDVAYAEKWMEYDQ